MHLSRRRFLQGGLIVGGAVVAGGLVAGAGASRPVELVPLEPDRPPRAVVPRRVVVIGGGLAGLSAAIELAERGLEVTVIEAGSACGGRAGGWSARVEGRDLPLEHGFHGFFSHYYCLDDLIERACDPADFVPVEAYPVAIAGRPLELLRPSRAGFPRNLLRVLSDSSNLTMGDVLPGGQHVLELLKYHPRRTFEVLDGVSFEDWCREMRVPEKLLEVFYRPFARTMFNPLDDFSAAEVIQLFHAYFIGNPEGLGFRVLERSAPEALIGPLTAYLERLGGRIRTGTPAHALRLEGDRVVGVVVRQPGAPRPVAILAAASVPAAGYVMVADVGGPVFVGRSGDGFVALDGRCTHQGCPVQWQPEAGGFRCPCHQGRFDAAGVPTGGPPKGALAPLIVRPRGVDLEILSDHDSSEALIEADYVVLATDVKGVRAIASATRWPSGTESWLASIEALRSAPPYLVARQWLERPVDPERYPLYTVAGYRYLDVLALYSQFQEPFRSLARGGGGVVLETHAYARSPGEGADLDRICDAMVKEAAAVLPELEGARAVHREVQWLDNFTGYGVGAQASRPQTGTPLANLLLAGDWVRLDLPVELMERAVVSGRLAANRILEREGVRRCPIRCVPLEGLLA